MRARFSLLTAICGGLLLAIPAHATLTFNVTYSSATQALPQFNQTGFNIQTAVNYVTNEYSGLFSDNITLNFTVDVMTGGLGMSSTPLQSSSYAQIKTALTNDSKSADDASFVASLPVASPTANNWWMAFAEAKALGLRGATDVASDGTYQFNDTVLYTFDPGNRQVAGEFDFIGVTEHEFSELMGRIPGLGASIGGSPANLPFDLARFTGNNVRSFANPGSGVYFSVNNGATDLRDYNSGGGDAQDWSGLTATDPFNASTATNQGHVLSSVDIRAMDILGFDLAAPEPPTFGLVGVVLLGVGLLGRRFISRKR
jgi:hypothetical protein